MWIIGVGSFFLSDTNFNLAATWREHRMGTNRDTAEWHLLNAGGSTAQEVIGTWPGSQAPAAWDLPPPDLVDWATAYS